MYSRLIEQEMQILCNKMQHTGFSELREGWSPGMWARGRRVGHGGVKRAQEGPGGGLSHHRSLVSFWEL